MERDQQLCERYPCRRSSHFFSSFFVNILLIRDKQYAYSQVCQLMIHVIISRSNHMPVCLSAGEALVAEVRRVRQGQDLLPG